MSYLPVGTEAKKRWLIVEWTSAKNKHSGYCLVSSEELLDSPRLQDLHTGKVVKVQHRDKTRKASIVIVSDDKGFLESEIKHLQEAVHQIGLNQKPTRKERERKSEITSNLPESDDEDFVNSGSDWNPENECSSDRDSDDSVNVKFNPKESKNSKNKSLIKQIKYNRKNNHISPASRPSVKMAYTDVQRRSSNFIDRNQFNTSGQIIANESCNNYNQQDNVTEISSVSGSTKKPYQSIRGDVEILHVNPVPPMTFDQQTQTNLTNCDSKKIELLIENQNAMALDIDYLNKTIENMRTQIDSMKRDLVAKVYTFDEQLDNTNEEVEKEYAYTPAAQSLKNSTVDSNSVLRECNRVIREQMRTPSNEANLQFSNNFSTPVNHDAFHLAEVQRNQTPLDTPKAFLIPSDGSEMVPIGSGKTLIPAHIFRQIKWNSYSSATRKLLMAVFPRRTLATHSLTGKSSPAFSHKPAKMQLDSRKITDIIMTVSKMCKVQENLVRNIITTKCSDENKMYRIRMEKMKNKELKKSEMNQENCLPE